MAIFSKFTKNTHNEKSIYPWSQRKLSGSSNALPRFGHGATMLDHQHFIVFGGVYTKGSTKKNMFIIDTNTMSASSISTTGDVPSPRSFTTMTTISGFILLYGGEPIVPGELWDPYFYVLHMNTKQWSRVRTKGNLPSERSGHSTCVSDDGIMYIWGGHFQRKYLNDLCAFNVKEYPSKAEWEFISYENQGPAPRSGHVSVIYDNKLYIFGGVNASHLYNDIWYFDLVTHQWHQIAAVGYIPAPRESCSAALIDDTIYIFGGKGLNGCGLGDLCAFRIKSQRWYTFQHMGAPPSPRYGSTLTVIQNKIYVFGGDSISGKIEDSAYVYILDCSKIKYPPEPELTESERSNAERVMMSSRKLPDQPLPPSPPTAAAAAAASSRYRTSVEEDEQVDPNIMKLAPQSPMRSPQRKIDEQKLNSPIAAHSMESNVNYNRQHEVPPPRPPREGATLLSSIVPLAPPPTITAPPPPPQPPQPSTVVDPAALKFRRESVQHKIKPPSMETEEKINLMREIMARDLIITEMRKKEQWWRTEVSVSRHLRTKEGEIVVKDDDNDDDTRDAQLMSFDDQTQMNDDKLLLFQQLIDVKSEIKKIRSSMTKQAEPISIKLDEAENVRNIALEEAAYYKSKYTALKTHDEEALHSLESDRVRVLEERLRAAYEEKSRTEYSIQQIQSQSQHDKAARLLAEERAKDAQAQSEEAQEAHQAALERLSDLYSQIIKAEAQGREDALVIANLSNEIANQLSMNEENDLSQTHIDIGRLEALNIKSRNQIALLSKQLEESKDEIMNLKILVNEKEQAYAEAVLELEKTLIELELMKNARSASSTATITTTHPAIHREHSTSYV